MFLGFATAPCSFPFKYNGDTYNTCTTAGDSDGRYWCAINMGDSSEDMKGTGKWVWCASRTSKTGTRKCKIPFQYKDYTYYDCTTADHPTKWCYFEEKEGSWGDC